MKGAGAVKNDMIQSLLERTEKEPYAKLLNMTVLEAGEGSSIVEMTLTPQMENIFGMTHGGAVFSLIDEAFEVASNSHGTVAVALNMNVTYIAAARTGDVLRAEAREDARTRRTAHYDITVRNGDGDLVATCSALVYRKDMSLPFSDSPREID